MTNPYWKQALYYTRGPFYRHFYPTYYEPITPEPNYGWLINPSIPRIDPEQFRATKPSEYNPIHTGLFNKYSKNMDTIRPEYYDGYVTVPQNYDDSDSFDVLNVIRNGPKNKLNSYYAHKFTSNTAKQTDEYITGNNTEENAISREMKAWGSALPALLANYGVKNLLVAGGLIGGLTGLGYGGYKFYNWWQNRKPKITPDAGVNVTSKELSNDDEENRPTNISLTPADFETKAKIRRLARMGM